MKTFHMMGRSRLVTLVFAATLCLGFQLPAAYATITETGNNFPEPVTTWVSGVSGTYGYVGATGGSATAGTGTVTLNAGDTLGSFWLLIGDAAGQAGTLTVDGTGAAFTQTSGDTAIGRLGSGVMNITNGGSYSASSNFSIGYTAGTVTVDGSSGGTASTLTIGGGGYGVFVGGGYNAASYYNGLTYQGSGVLSVTNGGVVSMTGASSYIGYSGTSTGTVTVDGTGSTWYASTSGISVGGAFVRRQRHAEHHQRRYRSDGQDFRPHHRQRDSQGRPRLGFGGDD